MLFARLLMYPCSCRSKVLRSAGGRTSDGAHMSNAAFTKRSPIANIPMQAGSNELEDVPWCCARPKTPKYWEDPDCGRILLERVDGTAAVVSVRGMVRWRCRGLDDHPGVGAPDLATRPSPHPLMPTRCQPLWLRSSHR